MLFEKLCEFAEQTSQNMERDLLFETLSETLQNLSLDVMGIISGYSRGLRWAQRIDDRPTVMTLSSVYQPALTCCRHGIFYSNRTVIFRIVMDDTFRVCNRTEIFRIVIDNTFGVTAEETFYVGELTDHTIQAFLDDLWFNGVAQNNKKLHRMDILTRQETIVELCPPPTSSSYNFRVNHKFIFVYNESISENRISAYQHDGICCFNMLDSPVWMWMTLTPKLGPLRLSCFHFDYKNLAIVMRKFADAATQTPTEHYAVRPKSEFCPESILMDDGENVYYNASTTIDSRVTQKNIIMCDPQLHHIDHVVIDDITISIAIYGHCLYVLRPGTNITIYAI